MALLQMVKFFKSACLLCTNFFSTRLRSPSFSTPAGVHLLIRFQLLFHQLSHLLDHGHPIQFQWEPMAIRTTIPIKNEGATNKQWDFCMGHVF